MSVGMSLDQMLALREMQQHQLQNSGAGGSATPYARINPPTTIKGINGNQIICAPGELPKQIVNWPGEDIEAQPCTMTVAPVTPFVNKKAAGNFSYRPYAIVQWGSKGVLVKAEVDILRGCQFTIGASAVIANVAIESAAADGYTEVEPQSITAMLSWWPIVRTAPLTRTRFAHIGPFPLASTAQFLLPPFAKNVFVTRNDSTKGITITVAGLGGVTIYTFAVAGGTVLYDPLPLPDDTESVFVGGAGADLQVRAIFGLSI
jgi:hypothetical protein